MTDSLSKIDQKALIRRALHRMKKQNQKVTLMMLKKPEIEQTFQRSAQVKDMLLSPAFCFKDIGLIIINEDVFSDLGKVSQLFVLEHELAHLIHPWEVEECKIDSLAFSNMQGSGDQLSEIELEKILVNDSFLSKSKRLSNFNLYLSHGKSKHEADR